MKAGGPCALCGKNPADGHAGVITDAGTAWYCHGDFTRGMTCFERIQQGLGRNQSAANHEGKP